MPIKVTVGARFRLPNVEFESRTIEVEYSNTEWGIPEPQSKEEALEVLGRLTYLGNQHLLKTMVAARRYTVDEAKGILTRIAKAHGFVEVAPDEAQDYLPALDVVREDQLAPESPAALHGATGTNGTNGTNGTVRSRAG